MGSRKVHQLLQVTVTLYLLTLVFVDISSISQIVFTRHWGLKILPIMYLLAVCVTNSTFWENSQHLLSYTADFDVGPGFLNLENTANAGQKIHSKWEFLFTLFRLYYPTYNRYIYYLRFPWLLNSFHATDRYPLNTSENQRFSDVFRGYQSVAWNGLITNQLHAFRSLGSSSLQLTGKCNN